MVINENKKVYLLMETGEHYDGGDFVRGVYASREAAYKAITGSDNNAYTEEWEVQGQDEL